jgi:hypothetical protein
MAEVEVVVLVVVVLCASAGAANNGRARAEIRIRRGVLCMFSSSHFAERTTVRSGARSGVA